MDTKSIRIRRIIVLPVFLLAAGISLYGQAKKSMGGEVTLAYNFPAGKTLTYWVNTSVNQQMEIAGQAMNIIASNRLVYKIALQKRKDKNMIVNITVDTLRVSVDAMGNTTGGIISDVAGKSFNMVLTPGGKIVDNSEGTKITYSTDGQNTGDLGQTFSNIFPTLPLKPVKPGEAWTSTDSIQSQSAGANVFQILESANTYEKNENINGIMCAKVVSSVKGTNQTSTKNNGMDILMQGPVEGQSVIYFALDGGYVVKEEKVIKMNGTMEISSPQNMTFPIIMISNTTMQLR